MRRLRQWRQWRRRRWHLGHAGAAASVVAGEPLKAAPGRRHAPGRRRQVLALERRRRRRRPGLAVPQGVAPGHPVRRRKVAVPHLPHGDRRQQ
jgi:hypothetical protein